MLLHLLSTVEAMGAERASSWSARVANNWKQRLTAWRRRPLAGRAEGHRPRVQMAEDALKGFEGQCLILYGDTPFVTRQTLEHMLGRLAAADDPGIVVLASSPADGKNLWPRHPGRWRPYLEDGRV
jgi:bifunctional UDP-N-acetylglucosamine pyrophosphorylase/glucosamine-1-phosphate N-acetyltransferase